MYLQEYPHPFHEPEWLELLRVGNPSDQLFRHLMLYCPLLNAYWLDLHRDSPSPLTGMPGLYTLYDIDTFAKRHADLVDTILAEMKEATNAGQQYEFAHVAQPGWEYGNAMSKRQIRRRRTRACIWFLVKVMSRCHEGRFARARRYEAMQHNPHTPFHL